MRVTTLATAIARSSVLYIRASRGVCPDYNHIIDALSIRNPIKSIYRRRSIRYNLDMSKKKKKKHPGRPPISHESLRKRMYCFRIDDARLKRYKKAAVISERNTSEWMRDILDLYV